MGGHLTDVLVCASQAEADELAADEEYGSFLRVVAGSPCRALTSAMVGRVVVTAPATGTAHWQGTLSEAINRRPISWSSPGRERWEKTL